MAVTERRFDAFLSYSFAADRQLAHALERGLHRLARAWYQPRVLRVCRDLSNLPASSDLLSAIRDALADSDHFVLLASEQSAASSWVRQEIGYWQAEREPKTFLIALTSGTIVWDDEANDFDWTRTTALPRQLGGYFSAEPLWVNLGWTREAAGGLSLRNDRFRSDVATLAAPIRGLPKDFLDCEDQRLHRSAVRTRRSATSALALLLVLVTILAGVTWQQLNESNRQRDQALSRELAARAVELGDRSPSVSKLLSVVAWHISPTPQAKAGMLRAAARPGLIGFSANSAAVVSVAYSLDGKTIVAAGRDGHVRFWDATTHQKTGELTTHADQVAISPDGQHLTTAGDRDPAGDPIPTRFWDVATRQETGAQLALPAPGPTTEYEIRSHWSKTIAFSPDGRSVATGASDGTVRLWDFGTRQEIGPALAGHPGDDAPFVTFNPAGRTLATAGNDGTVRFWDTTTHQRIGQPLAAHTPDPLGAIGPVLAFSPDGATLASAGTDGTVRLWDADTGQAKGVPMSGHTRSDRAIVRPSVAFSPSGRMIATGSHDGTIRLWQVDQQQQIGEPLAGHSGPVTSVAFAPDGRTLTSAGVDGMVRLWHVAGYEQAANPLGGHVAGVYAIAFSPDGKTLASGGDYGGITDYLGSPFLCGSSGWGICLSGYSWLSASGEGVGPGRIVGPSRNDDHTQWRFADGPTVVLWDVERRRETGRMMTGHTRTIRALAFSPDGKALTGGGLDDPYSGSGRILTWDPSDRRTIASVPTGKDRAVWSVAYSPDGRSLVSGGDLQSVAKATLAENDFSMDGSKEPGIGEADNSTVISWDPHAQQRNSTLLYDRTTYSVTFSPNGSTIATSGADGLIRLWDAVSGKQLGEPLGGHVGAVGSVAFSPDGRTLASSGDDGTIRLWDAASRTQLGEPLLGHTGPVYSVTFNPSGTMIASGSGDNSVRLWDVATRTQVSESFLTHRGPVRAVRFSPDGRWLASGGEDMAVRLWDVGYAAGDVEKSLCAMVNRTLTHAEWERLIPDAPFHPVCR